MSKTTEASELELSELESAMHNASFMAGSLTRRWSIPRSLRSRLCENVHEPRIRRIGFFYTIDPMKPIICFLHVWPGSTVVSWSPI
jgi:hypothetical protein